MRANESDGTGGSRDVVALPHEGMQPGFDSSFDSNADESTRAETNTASSEVLKLRDGEH
jgi:hypothetical protein